MDSLAPSINPMAGKCPYIARVVYRMLKYKVEYEPLSVAEYEKHYQDQQLKYLEKKAAKFGLQLVPTWLFLRTRC